MIAAPRIGAIAGFCVLVTALLWTSLAQAARERPWRTVVLRDGTTHTGRFEELIDGRVRLEGDTGEFIFEADQIDAIYALAPPDSVGPPAQEGDFELGASTGLSLSAGATQYEDAQWRLRILGGYQLSRLFQVGFESGVTTDFREKGLTHLDLAATGTFHFGTSPIGYVRAIAGMQGTTYGGGFGVGPLIGAAAGVKVPLSRHGAILAGLTYAWSSQSLTAKRIVLGQPETEVSLQTHRIGVELGFLTYF